MTSSPPRPFLGLPRAYFLSHFPHLFTVHRHKTLFVVFHQGTFPCTRSCGSWMKTVCWCSCTATPIPWTSDQEIRLQLITLQVCCLSKINAVKCWKNPEQKSCKWFELNIPFRGDISKPFRPNHMAPWLTALNPTTPALNSSKVHAAAALLQETSGCSYHVRSDILPQKTWQMYWSGYSLAICHRYRYIFMHAHRPLYHLEYRYISMI